MKTVKLTQDLDYAGLAKGDILSVDELSAAGMIDRGVAEAYDAEEQAQEAAPPVKYGGQESRTIDDIRDPEVTRMTGVQATTIVAAPDPGPQPPAEDVAADTDSDAADSADAVDPEAGQFGETAALGNLPDVPAADAAAVEQTAPRSKKSTRVASGAQPAGGDADEGGTAG